MTSAEQDLLPHPGFDLQPPGTYIYTGPASTEGWRLNRVCLSLKSPERRAEFLADEAAYVARFGLTPAERALIAARDWTGLIEAGGHVQAVLKLAATLGLNLFHIAAHNVGTDYQTIVTALPRKVAALPEQP